MKYLWNSRQVFEVRLEMHGRSTSRRYFEIPIA